MHHWPSDKPGGPQKFLCFISLGWFFLILRQLQAEVRLFGQSVGFLSPKPRPNWDSQCSASFYPPCDLLAQVTEQLCEIPKVQSGTYWVNEFNNITCKLNLKTKGRTVGFSSFFILTKIIPIVKTKINFSVGILENCFECTKKLESTLISFALQ